MAKKSGTAIRDFFISLGFDASEVEKGFKQIEKEFSKLQKTLNGTMTANVKVQQQQNKAQKESVKQSKAKVTSEKQLYAIEKARAELKRKIAYIEKQEKALGTYVPGHYKDQKNAARSKNIDRIKIESDKLNETYRTYANLEKTLAKQERDRASAADRANKAQIRADKARIKEQQRLEKQSLDSLNRQRQFAYSDNLRALNRQRRLAIRQQMIEDRREAAGSRVSRITRRADWMMQRQGGMAAGLSNTAEYQNYTRQLSNVNQMKAAANSASDFRRLNSAMADLNLSYNQLIVKNRELQREFKASSFTAKALQDSLRNLARSYVSVFAVIGGTGMAATTGQDLVALRTTLLAATGSAEEAGKAFEFVKSQALGMGLDLQSATKGFAQMGVAAKMAGLSADQTKEIFTGLAEATAAFGMNTVDAERTLRAVTQMMNKGQVYAEELKQQLGESLPAAVPLAAKAMGVTTQELFKMMEQGKIVANDFLPKFTKTLREAVREGNALGEGLNTSRVAMARFGTSFKLNILGAFDAGAEKGLANFFNQLTLMMENAAPAMRVIGKVVGGLLSFIGTAFRAIYQVWRPVQILLEKSLVGGVDKANDGLTTMGGILESLYRGFKKLAGVVLVPFALAELGSDRLEKLKSGFTGNKIEYPEGSILKEGSGNTLLDMAARYVVGRYVSKAETPQTKNEVNIQIQGASLDDDSWIDKMKNAMSDVLQGEYTLNVAGGS